MTTASSERLSHAKWDGKYHVVFSPKGRKKALYGKIRSCLGPVLRELAEPRGSTIVAGHRVQAHVHRLIRIPPKYAVAEVIGSIKGQSAIAVARQCGGRQRNFNGERFWARGGMRCPRWVVRKSRFARISSIRSSSTLRDRRSQASAHNVTEDPGSPEGCSQPSSPQRCGGVMTHEPGLSTAYENRPAIFRRVSEG